MFFFTYFPNGTGPKGPRGPHETPMIATLDRPNLKLISGQDRLIAQADVKILDFVDAYNPYGDGKSLTGNHSKITSNLEKVGINVEAIQGGPIKFHPKK